MKSRVAALAFSLAALAACDKGPKPGTATAAAPTAAPAAAPAAGAPAAATGQKFGAGVTLTASTPIATLLADPKPLVGQKVRVEGMVVDVCEMRGCWMDLAGSAPGQKLRFKVTDGDMVFPMDAKGKYAVVEGVVAVNDLSLEQSKEYLKHQKEEGADVDPDSCTEPMSIVRLDGTGAMLRDRM